MKELSLEQKAQRYDEAVEKAKKELASCGNGRTKMLKRIFPELAESEDENIRKSIIELLNEVHFTFKYYDINKMLAWLEKRGGWKPSEEQMYNLSEAAHYDCAFFDMEILKGLYDDLKQL